MSEFSLDDSFDSAVESIAARCSVIPTLEASKIIQTECRRLIPVPAAHGLLERRCWARRQALMATPIPPPPILTYPPPPGQTAAQRRAQEVRRVGEQLLSLKAAIWNVERRLLEALTADADQ